MAQILFINNVPLDESFIFMILEFGLKVLLYIIAPSQPFHVELENLKTSASVFYTVECGKVSDSFLPKLSVGRCCSLAIGMPLL